MQREDYKLRMIAQMGLVLARIRRMLLEGKNSRRALLSALPLLVACYNYVPIEPAMARPGMSVRARVSGATAEQIEPILGISNARLLDGRLIDVHGDTLIVEVPAVLRAEIGSSIQTLYQRIAIPRAGLFELESRQLDRTRTTIVAAAGGIVVGGLIVRAIRGNPGEEGLPGGGGAEFRVPFSFFLRR